MDTSLEQKRQQVLYDKKWEKLLRRVWLFRFTPFVEFAVAAGSMAIGNVRPDSDFDVIIGVRSGRIFTARFFTVILFGLFGWRRKKLNHKESAADKICLNHFLTEQSFRLSPPHDNYWRNLYLSLVPVFGPVDKISRFFQANADWLEKKRVYEDDLRHFYRKNSFPKSIAEFLLSGGLGDWLEKILRKAQVNRIERSLRRDVPGFRPRIVYTDTELEFHPDTRRAAEFAGLARGRTTTEGLAKQTGSDNV